MGMMRPVATFDPKDENDAKVAADMALDFYDLIYNLLSANCVEKCQVSGIQAILDRNWPQIEAIKRYANV